MNTIAFNGKSFCFTGQLAELKRSQAEREVRSRLGLNQEAINGHLDYLVIGSIPSLSWKHGDYGKKIEKAREAIKGKKSLLKLVSEYDFMLALENTPVVDSGELDEKIVIVRYNVFVQNGAFNLDGIESYLDILKNSLGCHVNASIEEPFIYQDLYEQYTDKDLGNLLLIRCRIARLVPMEFDSRIFVMDIDKGFQEIDGLDGELTFSEKKEGTASYASLLKGMPQNTKLGNRSN